LYAEVIEYAAGYLLHITAIESMPGKYTKAFFRFSLQCLDEHTMYQKLKSYKFLGQI